MAPTTPAVVKTTCAVRSVIVNQTSKACMANATKKKPHATGPGLAGERPKRTRCENVMAAPTIDTKTATTDARGEVAISMTTTSAVKKATHVPQTAKP